MMMKKLLLSAVILYSVGMNAQTITTQSSCDTNNDGKVDITDVTNATNKLLAKDASESNVVTAEQLKTSFNAILEKLSSLETRVSSLEQSNAKMEQSLGMTNTVDGHAYVDLGLSVKWATCNLGADSPESYGLHYAWGETTGYDGRKTYFLWNRYALCNGTSSSLTKYNTTDEKTLLEASDDAATVNWGSDWRIPTDVEQEELMGNCYWEWTSSYNDTGVAGYIVYKVKAYADRGVKKPQGSSATTTGTYSLADTHIFLPASGFSYNGGLCNATIGGFFWASTIYPYGYACISANYLEFYTTGTSMSNRNRFYGLTIRPVCE